MTKIKKKEIMQLIIDYINNWNLAKEAYGYDELLYKKSLSKCEKIEEILFKHNQQNELYKYVKNGRITN